MNGYTITPNLGEQVGIQWGGLVDRTETNNSSNGAPILIGYFKRGNPSKVVKVTEKTIRAVLGYEPKNPHYQQAVLMLKQGVSPLSVVSLGKLNNDDNSGGSESDSCSDIQAVEVQKATGSGTPEVIFWTDSTRTVVESSHSGLNMSDGIFLVLEDLFAETSVEFSSTETGALSFTNKVSDPIFFDINVNQDSTDVYFKNPSSNCLKITNNTQTIQVTLGASPFAK